MRTKMRLAVIVTAGTLLVGAGACGDDDGDVAAQGEVNEAQPAPGGAGFDAGIFDEIPRYHRSKALGEAADVEGATSQSFRARGATPRVVLEFYEQRLPAAGWEATTPVRELGPGTWRGRWSRPGWLLTVSASAAPTLRPEGEAEIAEVAQYSLSVRPAQTGEAASGEGAGGEDRVEIRDVGDFPDDLVEVVAVRDYDPVSEETAFSWQVATDGSLDTLQISPCRDVAIVTAVGTGGQPTGSAPVPLGDKVVPQVTWERPPAGTYTVEFDGPVAWADLALRHGDAWRYYRVGAEPCAGPVTVPE